MHKLLFDLQLFSDGGADGSGADAAGANDTAQETGETAQDAAVQTGGKQDASDGQDAAAKRKADYKAFKDQYRAEYDADVQNILKRRMKSAEKAQQEADAFKGKAEQIMRVLAVKYGTDDLDQLVSAVEGDDGFFEDEAIRRGMDVEALRSMQATAWENEQLKAQQQQQEADREYQKQLQTWQRWEAEAKAVYPQFDFETEMENPAFAQLARAGVDFKTAYQVAHLNDSLAGAMQFGAQETQRRMQQVQIPANRPDENALQSGTPMKQKLDIEKMSNAEIDDIIARARRGERVTLQS